MTKNIYRLTTADRPYNSEWEIHRDNCPDLKGRRLGMRETRLRIKANTPEEARTYWHDDELIEMGWTEDYTRIMDCAR